MHQIDIGAALDQYHYLLGAHALGQHGGHDVGLIVVGDSDEDIHLLDVLFGQQLLVGGIAVEHDGIVQLLGQFGGALLVSLDKFDVVVFFQLGGQAGADVAATDDHDALIRFPAAAVRSSPRGCVVMRRRRRLHHRLR